MSRSFRLAASVVVCLGTFLPAPASALDFEEWVPGLTVTPFVSEKVEYESNVFQTPNNTRGDTIFKTIPGFLAELSRGPLILPRLRFPQPSFRRRDCTARSRPKTRPRPASRLWRPSA